MRKLAFALTIVLLSVSFASVAAEEARVFRYVGGSWQERQVFSGGGFCTTDTTLVTGDGVIEEPFVVGGMCHVDLHAARSIRILVQDDARDNTPLLYEGGQAFSYEFWGGSAPHVTCAQGGGAWGIIALDVPHGCTDVSVYLGAGATTGTIGLVTEG